MKLFSQSYLNVFETISFQNKLAGIIRRTSHDVPVIRVIHEIAV